MPKLEDVTDECPSCVDYIEEMAPNHKGRYKGQKESYELNQEAVAKLKEIISDYEIVAVFADWCGDARKAVPVLSLLEEELDIRIRALGGMTKPPYGSKKHWAVPPSPKEVDTFGITSSPTIIIFDKNGDEVGRIKTRPKMTKTIEQEILKILEG
ncbi:MAG: thioredoxin family protein [Candidatus Thorarchaeota archaeon]